MAPGGPGPTIARHGTNDNWEWVAITGPSAYETGLDRNRIPLVLTYDAKNDRTDAVIGLLLEEPTANSDGTSTW